MNKKQWFVAQVYAGYEEAVKKDLCLRIKEREGDFFGEVLVPSARTKSYFGPHEQAEDERLFPGYVLVEMEKTPETLSLVASIPKFLKFLGGTNPVALTKKELERIVSQVKGEVSVAPSVQSVDFAVGSEITIKEGPFSGFVGIVDRIDQESEKLTVMVSIFGRLTPVELTFDQVKE